MVDKRGKLLPFAPPKPSGSLVKVGGPVTNTKLSLRFFGADLDPDWITKLLGAAPSVSGKRGDVTAVGKRGRTRILREGRWLLESTLSSAAAPEDHVAALLDRTTSDLAAWLDVERSGARGDLFFGIFLEDANRGFELSPAVLERVALRRLTLSFDVYSP